MSTIQISIPNDFQSKPDYEAAIIECYGSPEEEADAADGGRAIFDRLAEVANDAGLRYVESTDFGAVWAGSDSQIAAARAALPAWAYAHTAEDDDFAAENGYPVLV